MNLFVLQYTKWLLANLVFQEAMISFLVLVATGNWLMLKGLQVTLTITSDSYAPLKLYEGTLNNPSSQQHRPHQHKMAALQPEYFGLIFVATTVCPSS